VRPLGPAELLVEASFTDMRHGGDGNLSRAYELAKKNMHVIPSEQPFPDSWVATTSPIALGTLTDIITEIAVKRCQDGRSLLLPPIMLQFQLWSVGLAKPEGDVWQPCEAIVRVACREMHRMAIRLNVHIVERDCAERIAWIQAVLEGITSSMSLLVDIETCLKEKLIRSKSLVYGPKSMTNGEGKPLNAASAKQEEEEELGEVVADVIVYTPYGKGRLIRRRKDSFLCTNGDRHVVIMNVIKLDFGGTLYRPAIGTSKLHKAAGEGNTEAAPTREASSAQATKASDLADIAGPGQAFLPVSREAITRETWWHGLVGALKIRCVAIHCLQHYLYDLFNFFLPLTSQDIVEKMLETLNNSKALASKASKNEDLSHAFQEAMFSQWGDGVEEVEEALSNTGRMTHRRGSEMFFLHQEAGAMNDMIHLLSLLYSDEEESELPWNRESFAEPLLLDRIQEVLEKFVESEARDGHLIDPNVWRNASESGGKLAIYCTSFAGVVVNILHIMNSMSQEKFGKHVKEFFPVLCSLVLVQSDEIRLLVKDVLEKQIAPKLLI
jgi:hypothetical protein